MWEIISPFLLGILVYCLVTQVVENILDVITGGISDDEAKDEKIK